MENTEVLVKITTFVQIVDIFIKIWIKEKKPSTLPHQTKIEMWAPPPLGRVKNAPPLQKKKNTLRPRTKIVPIFVFFWPV